VSILPPGTVELLAPARDLECGRAAIDCGADAVYIGASRFGAREAAGNSVEDIAALAAHAHLYHARVYAAVNTLLRDDELPQAMRLIGELADAGVDALIIQDAGLLECDLPPLPLIASTQMHNHTPERVAFLAAVGFSRAILARELTLDQIRAVREGAPGIELEVFVHGALCVCYSGQCTASYALGGRSANRGQCAQPCRKAWAVFDARGAALPCGPHPLSLRDLDLSAHYGELLASGVTSFKIEGRLKDRAYVMNAVAHHRARLDAALAAVREEARGKDGPRRSSSGRSDPGFVPDPAKTFNRGFTPYFIHGRARPVSSPLTPKMMGDEVARVTAVGRGHVWVELKAPLAPGDGLCFFDAAGELRGTGVSKVAASGEGAALTLEDPEGLAEGTVLMRNRDQAFLAALRRARPRRAIGVTLALTSGPGGLTLTAVDEDKVRGGAFLAGPFPAADKEEAAREAIGRQLAKTGGAPFRSDGVRTELSEVPFLPLSALNSLRRDALAALAAAREAARPRPRGGVLVNSAPFPESELTFRGNVLNRKAAAFYRRHGVASIEPAAESGIDLAGRPLMTLRFCPRFEIGQCPKQEREPGQDRPAAGPWTLRDGQGNALILRFDCAACRVEVFLA
jgi:23S rRNA 5-hydroxycytidine C2501 synthase